MPDLPPEKTPDTFPPGWNPPKPVALAKPTWWPAALAFGVTLTGWGLITSVVILAVGLVIVVLSLAGWIGDICHERKSH
jgi:hypothetical protein